MGKRVYRLFFVLFISCTSSLTSQFLISGKVIAERTGEPIPYANIGILNTSVGTISETDGTFSLQIPEKYISSTLRFSSLGFGFQSLPLKQLMNDDNLTIRLSEKALTLDPIELTPKKREKKREITLGNGKSLLLSGQLAYDTLYAGSALALKIDLSRYKDFKYVHKASLYIAGNRMPDFKVRLRFLAVDTANNGKPGQHLFEDQIIVTSSIRKGWLDFELPKSYTVEEDQFYIVFEWILDRKDRRYIADTYAAYMLEYPERIQYDTLVVDGELIATAKMGKILAGTLFGTASAKKDAEHLVSYTRDSSFGSWERMSKVLSARIQMGNYPLQ